MYMKPLHGIFLKKGRLFTTDKVCIRIPMSIETRTDMHAAYIQMGKITPSHTRSHTLPPPPMAPYTLPPSLPHSLKRREPVKDARRQHDDRVAGKVQAPGHETRRQSALTLSTSKCPLCPSACTCQCPMHMHAMHMHVCTVACLSLNRRAPCMRVRMCMCL